MNNALRISAALHQTRFTATADNLHELAVAICTSQPHEIALGLAQYGHDLIRAAEQVLRVHRDALVSADGHESNDGRAH